VVDRFESVILESELIRLRPTCVADARPAFELIHERAEVLDWLIWDGPTQVSELEDWYATWRDDAKDASNYRFAIEDLSDGAFLGSISLRFEGHPHQGDIGYWVRSDAWGRGIATDALRLVDWFGFKRCKSLLHYATVFVGNDPSVRVLLKNGYVEDPAGASRVAKHGKEVERRFFSVNRRAWAAHAGGNEPRRVVVSPRAR